MKISFADGLRGYSSGADMAQEWHFVSAPVLAYPAGAAAEMRCGAITPAGVITRNIDASPRAAISVDVRLPAANGQARIALSPAGYADRNRTTSGQSPAAVYLHINGLTPRIYYDILTGPTGTAVNSLMLAELAPLLAGVTYHIEMIIDHTEDLAHTRIYINDAIAASVTYARDRISSGYQSLAFGEAALHTTGPFATSYPLLSSVVSYEPDDGAAPLGPLDITYLTTPDATLSVGPAVDTTGVTILENAWRDFALSDIGAGGEILGAELLYRIAAINGQAAANAEVAMEAHGIQRGETDSPIITPGYAPKLLSVPLPPTALAPAILNDLKIKIRSIAGGA